MGEDAESSTPRQDDLRYVTRLAVERVKDTVDLLRGSQGIAVPKFHADWDAVPTSTPTPRNTILAYEGPRESVRVTIHFGRTSDDTSIDDLSGLGISHLIGLNISAGHTNPVWISSPEGGMLAVVKLSLDVVEDVVHDIFVDMAMAHAKGHPWSPLYQAPASERAALKGKYLRSIGPSTQYPHGDITATVYAPISAVARTSKQIDFAAVGRERYCQRIVEVWNDFAKFATSELILSTQEDIGRSAGLLLAKHRQGGQISPLRLQAVLDCLSPGHYYLYTLNRKPKTKKKAVQVSGFFHRSFDAFRRQRWIVLPRSTGNKLEHILLNEGIISRYPFYLGNHE